jgi:hypothetical protein
MNYKPTEHRCRKSHRTNRRLASCVRREAAWIIGTGPFALVARCGGVTVTLWKSMEAATESREFIDRLGCGHACHGDHEIIQLRLGRRSS